MPCRSHLQCRQTGGSTHHPSPATTWMQQTDQSRQPARECLSPGAGSVLHRHGCSGWRGDLPMRAHHSSGTAADMLQTLLGSVLLVAPVRLLASMMQPMTQPSTDDTPAIIRASGLGWSGYARYRTAGSGCGTFRFCQRKCVAHGTWFV